MSTRTGNPAAAEREWIAPVIADYRPQPGLYDEMMDSAGRIRPHWNALLDAVAALGPREFAARFDAANRYLGESGVFYRVYGDAGASERPWRLSHIPLLIPPDEWKTIEAGVLQRAALMEAILTDCYGPQRLISDGALPAAAIAGSPDFLRPLAGVSPVSGRPLALYAVDIGRSPDGAWWVLRDRTQSPSGVGYALENRTALSRAFPGIFRAFGIERIAPFLDAFRSWLSRFREPGDAGIFVLTPGAFSETYFEHAWLARHLGMRLVEGADLTVREGAVYLRTVSGLVRVRVLWRRIDGDFADPLELDARSQLGVAGLTGALRQGAAEIANALGSGLGETPALLGFMPALARHLLGTGLILPNVATWWCGQAAERAYVMNNLESLVVAPAFRPLAGGQNGEDGGPWLMAEAGPGRRQAVLEALERRGIDYVGQEAVNLSTTPVWANGRLEPRPFVLRVFAAATGGGFTVMPGGLALIGGHGRSRAVSMQSGASSADVWVLAPGGASDETAHAPPQARAAAPRVMNVLPSRAADNLFWLGRYTERADATLRLIRALAERLTGRRGHIRPSAASLADLLFKWGAAGSLPAGGNLAETAVAAMCDGTRPGSVPSLVRAARTAASVIRDRFPPDAWRALEDLHVFVHTPLDPGPPENTVHAKASAALRILAAVAGFQFDTMHRLSGWRFLETGRRIERAISVSRFVRQFASEDGDGPPDVLEVLPDLSDSQIACRVRSPFGIARTSILELVLFEKSNPRSFAFQAARLAELAAGLPRVPSGEGPSAVERVTAGIAASLYATDAERVTASCLLGLENQLMRLSNEIGNSYFSLREPAPPGGGH